MVPAVVALHEVKPVYHLLSYCECKCASRALQQFIVCRCPLAENTQSRIDTKYCDLVPRTRGVNYQQPFC